MHITMMFTCISNSFRAASCINDLEGIESGCQYVKATLVADVKSKFQEIYHVVPECPYGGR